MNEGHVITEIETSKELMTFFLFCFLFVSAFNLFKLNSFCFHGSHLKNNQENDSKEKIEIQLSLM